jgi:hypothetical protein
MPGQGAGQANALTALWLRAALIPSLHTLGAASLARNTRLWREGWHAGSPFAMGYWPIPAEIT